MMELKAKRRKQIFYPASYLVMTLTSLLFLGAVSGLAAITIHYWFLGTSNLINDWLIFYWIAIIVVIAPLHFLAYRQVIKADKQQITAFSLRVTHGLLGVYLVTAIASYILLAVWLIGLWLNTALGTGTFDKALIATSLSLAVAVAWYWLTAKHFLYFRSGTARPKLYLTISGVLGAAVLVLSLVFPAWAYRDVAHDAVKSNDLWQIQQSVGSYVDEHGKLPDHLNQLQGLPDDTNSRVDNYDYTPRGDGGFGIFAYSICADFARSAGQGSDAGFGYDSHASGKQCFIRSTISFDQLNQDLHRYVQNVENGAARLQVALKQFLLGAKQAVDQEVSGVENFAGNEVAGLETHLEGLEGGTTELQQEMQRLESNMGGLTGDTGDLAKDMDALEKFFHDLGCLFGGCQ
jgi:hypothetical protein